MFSKQEAFRAEEIQNDLQLIQALERIGTMFILMSKVVDEFNGSRPEVATLTELYTSGFNDRWINNAEGAASLIGAQFVKTTKILLNVKNYLLPDKKESLDSSE